MKSVEWKTYRTRFLVKAKQLSSTLSFTDHLGRQHCGRKGDYLVESFDGVLSIAPRQIFEDVYVSMSESDSDAAANPVQSVTPAPEVLSSRNLRVEALSVERITERIKDVPASRVENRRSHPEKSARTPRKSPQSVRATSSRLSLM